MKNSRLWYFIFTIIWALWALGIWVAIAQVSFPDALNTQFPDYMENEGMLHFNYDGNNFEGIIFPMWSATITGVDIVLSWNTKYDCDKQITGLYYNNARGLRIWPLDQATLSGLRNMDSSYDNLTLTGGLFHSCSGTDENEVYGQLTYTLDTIEYNLIAWVDYNFANNTYLSTFSGSLKLTWNKLTWFIFDNIWGIADVSLEPLVPIVNLFGYMTFYLPRAIIGGNTLTTAYTSGINITMSLDINQDANYTLTGDFLWDRSWILSSWGTHLNLSLLTGEGRKAFHFTSYTGAQSLSATELIYLDTTAPTIPTLSAPISWSTVQWDTTLTWTGGVDSGVGIESYVYTIYSISGSGTGTVLTLATTGSVTSNTATISFTTLSTWDYQWTVKARDKLWYTTLSTTWYFSTESAVVDENPNSFLFSKIRDAKLSKVYQSNMVIIQWLSAWTSVEAEVDAGVLLKNGNFLGSTGLVENGDVLWIELISSNRYDHEVDAKLTIWDKSDTFVIQTMREEDDTNAGNYAYALSNSLRWTIWQAFQDLVDIYHNKTLTRQRDVFMTLREILQTKMLSTRIKIKVTHTSTRELKYKQQLTVLAYLYSYTMDYLTDKLDINQYLIDSEVDYDGVYRAKWNNKSYKLEYSASKGYYSDDMSSRKYFPTLDAIKDYIDINNPWVIF